MKKTKKLLNLALVLLMSFTLVACKGKIHTSESLLKEFKEYGKEVTVDEFDKQFTLKYEEFFKGTEKSNFIIDLDLVDGSLYVANEKSVGDAYYEFGNNYKLKKHFDLQNKLCSVEGTNSFFTRNDTKDFKEDINNTYRYSKGIKISQGVPYIFDNLSKLKTTAGYNSDLFWEDMITNAKNFLWYGNNYYGCRYYINDNVFTVVSLEKDMQEQFKNQVIFDGKNITKLDYEKEPSYGHDMILFGGYAEGYDIRIQKRTLSFTDKTLQDVNINDYRDYPTIVIH